MTIIHVRRSLVCRVAYRIVFGGGGGGGGSDLTDNMRRCHAYILVNRSHNNAVITNFFLFACVCNHIICAVYITCILLWNSGGGGGGGGGGGDPSAPPPPLYATLVCILWHSLTCSGTW